MSLQSSRHFTAQSLTTTQYLFLALLFTGTSAPSKKATILGLQQTIFICVVALVAGLCILGVAVIIFFIILRRSRRGHAQIYKEKPDESLDASEPQGLLSKPPEKVSVSVTDNVN